MNAQNRMNRAVAILLTLLLAFATFAAPATYAEELPADEAVAEEQALSEAADVAAETENAENDGGQETPPAAEPEAPAAEPETIAAEQAVLPVEQDAAVAEIAAAGETVETDPVAEEITAAPQEEIAEEEIAEPLPQEEPQQQTEEEAAEQGEATTYAAGELQETIPVISLSSFAETDKVVLIKDGGTPAGYSTLKAAMEAIGADTSGTGNYTLVFIQDYLMVTNTDQDAITAGTPNAASLTVTSTYKTSESATPVISVVTSNTGGTGWGADWNFKSPQTLVHDFSLNCTGHARFLAWGHDLTMGKGINITGGGSVQLAVGGGGKYSNDDTCSVGTAEKPADGHLTVKSGTYQYLFCASTHNAGKCIYTGTSTVLVEGTTTIKSNGGVYAGGNFSVLAPNSKVKITIDGTGGGVNCNNIYSRGLNPANNELDTSGSLTLTLKDIDRGGIDLSVGNNAPSTLHIEGEVVMKDGPITVTNLELADGATLKANQTLTLAGNLTLGAGSHYIRTGNGAQTVGGDLIVNGTNAEMILHKKDAATAPVKMTVGGEHKGESLKISLMAAAVAVDYPNSTTTFLPKDGNIVFTYPNNTTAAAAAAKYNEIEDTPNHTVYATIAKDANVVYKAYIYPTYYKATDVPDLYKFDEVNSTDGKNKTVYRKCMFDRANGTFTIYEADASGAVADDASPLTPAELAAERPQPNAADPVDDYDKFQATMIRIDEVGHYKMTVAAATNYSGKYDEAKGKVGNGIATAIGTASGLGLNGDGYAVNADGAGEVNASWAYLHLTPQCSVHKAYLVMTTTLRGNAGVNDQAQIESNIVNKPMTLRYDSKDGPAILSNGYLPRGAVVGMPTESPPSLSFNTPTLLYDRLSGRTDLGEAMTITDVTDFVKAHGEGKYYGIDIHQEGVDVDAAIGWRLIVVEEDPTMEYLRKTSIQMGPITNGNVKPGEQAVSVTLDLDGFTTPDVIGTQGFGGQLLMIGSDNTTDPTVGGGTGSNLHNTFYPDPTNRLTESVLIGSNDPDTGVTDRPIIDTSQGQVGHWSQGLMDIDGVNLTANDVSHIEQTGAVGSFGMDLSLLTVTNEKNENWATTGGHNLYLTPSSPSVMITSKKDGSGVGYIDVLGLSTDIAVPQFDTQIVHTDIATVPAEGVDIVAGRPVIVKGTATNVTPDASIVAGSFNTKVTVTLDEKLSNPRPVGWKEGESTDIEAIFHNYDPVTKTTKDEKVIGHYNLGDNTIVFDFGSDFNLDASLTNPKPPGLFNTKDDKIDIVFMADTNEVPTLNDPAVSYTNAINVKGQVIYQKVGENSYSVLDTPDTVYAFDDDTFNTYLHNVTLSKLVKGDIGDPDKAFTFALKVRNSAYDEEKNYGLLPEGTVLHYTGGTLASVPTATAPADGTVTVDAGGVATIQLKHGQTVTFTDIPFGTIEIAETDAPGYTLVYDKKTQVHAGVTGIETPPETAVAVTDHNTGPIDIGKPLDYTFDFINTKTSTPPTGVRTKALPFLILALAALGGLVLTTALGAAEESRRRRE